MSRKHYPSDISREQFSKIQPILEQARRKTRPRTIDLYEVFCGVLYVLKSGCQWRMIPSDFPKWRTVYSYFQIWSQTNEGQPESLLAQALKKKWLERSVPAMADKRKQPFASPTRRASRTRTQQGIKDTMQARRCRVSSDILV